MKKKTENMTLEELLELDNKIPVLSRKDFYINFAINSVFPVCCSSLAVSTINSIHNFNENPNIINAIATGINGICLAYITNIVAKNIKLTKTFLFKKNYEAYRENLPIKKEINRLYNQLLEDLIETIDNSSIDKDTLSTIILIGDILIPYGLLSYTKKFHIITKEYLLYELNPEFYTDKIAPQSGMYIPAGYGCCRHVNGFICDLLTKKGIESDRIPCVNNNEQEIQLQIEEFNYDINHLITGFIENNKYHIVDAFNGNYSLKKEQDYYTSPITEKKIMPVFEATPFQNNYHYHPNILYAAFEEKEIKEKREKIEHLLFNEYEINNFIRFKISHSESIKKLAHLVPLELDRSPEKESQKTKKYRN